MEEILAIRNANKLAGIEWPTKRHYQQRQLVKQLDAGSQTKIKGNQTRDNEKQPASLQQKMRHPREQVNEKWEKPKCSQEIVAAKKRQRQNNCERCRCTTDR